MRWLNERIAVIAKIAERRWVRIALGLWAVIAFYDAALSQFMPESVAKKFPKMYELIAVTSGWLPYWGWALLLAGIFVAASIEFALRRTRPSATTTLKSSSEPNIDARIAFFDILKNSQWQAEQTPNVEHPRSDWMAVHLDREVHNLLRQSKLAAWGEANLSRSTGPEREIRPEEWDDIEIVFDEIKPQFPRTVAQYRVTKSHGSNIAYFGVRFCKEQINSRFPAQPSQEKPPSSYRGRDKPVAVSPRPQYSRAQINKIVEAIDAFYPPIVEIERALIFGKGIAGSLEGIIRHDGAAVFLNRMDELRLTLNAASDSLDRAVESYGLYTEACRIVSDKGLHQDPFFASYNSLAGILREIPDRLSAAALVNYVEAKKATFVSTVADYHGWTEKTKKALTDSRERFLGLQSTDDKLG